MRQVLDLVVVQIDGCYNPNAKLTGRLSSHTGWIRRMFTSGDPANTRRHPSTHRNRNDIVGGHATHRYSPVGDLQSDEERGNDLSIIMVRQ